METGDALRAYYERGMERERLSDGRGDLEFTRTTWTRGWRIRPTGPLRWAWHAPSSGYPS